MQKRTLLILVVGACLPSAACGTDPILPPLDREPMTQNTGRLLATDVPRLSQPGIDHHFGSSI